LFEAFSAAVRLAIVAQAVLFHFSARVTRASVRRADSRLAFGPLNRVAALDSRLKAW